MLYAVLGVSLFGIASLGATLGAAMGLTGFIILYFFADGSTNAGVYAVWDLMNSFTFSAIPMFILLGDLLVASGLSSRIYNAIAPLFERVPGQLLHSNIAVSTLFGAVSGSSAATSAAVGSVAAQLGIQLSAAAQANTLTKLTLSQVAPILPYLFLVLILIFRPRGLLGTREG